VVVKVAVTLLGVLAAAPVSMVTLQLLAVPEHAPPQPANVEPAAGVAARTTVDAVRKNASQVTPHSIPAGVLDTVPEPLPSF
jgi:hypothetical protein